jgi:hypothetical protein
MKVVLIYQRMDVKCLVKCKKIVTDIYETLQEICGEEIMNRTWDLMWNK